MLLPLKHTQLRLKKYNSQCSLVCVLKYNRPKVFFLVRYELVFLEKERVILFLCFTIDIESCCDAAVTRSMTIIKQLFISILI